MSSCGRISREGKSAEAATALHMSSRAFRAIVTRHTLHFTVDRTEPHRSLPDSTSTTPSLHPRLLTPQGLHPSCIVSTGTERVLIRSSAQAQGSSWTLTSLCGWLSIDKRGLDSHNAIARPLDRQSLEHHE